MPRRCLTYDGVVRWCTTEHRLVTVPRHWLTLTTRRSCHLHQSQQLSATQVDWRGTASTAQTHQPVLVTSDVRPSGCDTDYILGSPSSSDDESYLPMMNHTWWQWIIPTDYESYLLTITAHAMQWLKADGHVRRQRPWLSARLHVLYTTPHCNEQSYWQQTDRHFTSHTWLTVNKWHDSRDTEWKVWTDGWWAGQLS